MMQALVTLGLVFAQVGPVPGHKQDDSSGFLAEVRAVTEALHRSDMEVALPARSPGPKQQIVSADSLRHRVPKAAKQSYQRALKLSAGANSAGAARELEKAIELDPGFAMAHNNLGVQYAWTGQYQKAEAQFRRTIELTPESSVGHSNLALVLLKMGNRQEAELNLRRAVQLAPNDGKAHSLLGRLLSANPDTREEGQRHLDRAADFRNNEQ
jgi:Tfp pilus assembly protein PilF